MIIFIHIFLLLLNASSCDNGGIAVGTEIVPS